MSYSYLELIPEPQVFGMLKKPYDANFHNVIRTSAEKALRFIPGTPKALITDRIVTILSEQVPLKTISYFTAYANWFWDGPGLIVFCVNMAPIMKLNLEDVDEILRIEQQKVEEIARLSYEMHVEEYKSSVEGGLFPEYTFLPFEKTPEYYQRGIIITK